MEQTLLKTLPRDSMPSCRIQLPSTFQWLEVDLPDLVYYEEDVLENEKPRCRLERIPLDLSDAGARH